MITRNPC